MKINNKKHFEKLYSRIEIKEAKENRVNIYRCVENGHITKTIDRHVGVTPMFISCPKCGNRASSSFYTDTHPDIRPTYEWVVPSSFEIWSKYKNNRSMIDHIFRGGLELKKI